MQQQPSPMEQTEPTWPLPKTLQLSKDYHHRLEDLFKSPLTHTLSHPHMHRGIITNPKAIFGLIESSFLVELRTNLPLHFELKTQIMGFLKQLIDNFTLNAKFIYEDAILVQQDSCRINFVTYLVKDTADAYTHLTSTTQHHPPNNNHHPSSQNYSHDPSSQNYSHHPSSQNHQLNTNQPMQQQQQSPHQIYLEYINTCTSVFYLICSVCTLRTSELKLITNILAQLYYEQQLSTPLVAHCLRLLDAGLQERNISPYLYFTDNTKNDCVKVLFVNNKWPFAKGMTVFMWVNSLKAVDCRLLWIKTEDGNELVVKVVSGKLLVQTLSKDRLENGSSEVCDWPVNSTVALGLELEPLSEGIFKSGAYQLNIAVNSTLYNNVSSRIPKFQSSQFVSQFELLSTFIGSLYSVVISVKPELGALEQLCKFSKYGICRESHVWALVSSKVLKTESIICVFNSERCFQGLLINYVSEKNHACFGGRVSAVTYHKYDSKIIDIYLPFLYLLTLIRHKDAEWAELFDLAFQHILQIIAKDNYETDTILFLLYFLELNHYPITQSTLNYLYHSTHEHHNFYVNIVVKFLDVHALIERGLKIADDIQPYQDPVEKIILLFYLESHWAKKWNSLQGFQGWWSPLFFRSQTNHPFNPKDFKYNPNKESRVQWSVKNLVTKDYCKCFVQPVFVCPKYGELSKYREQYILKQCFEDFKVKLYHQPERSTLVCNKISSSSLERIRSKLIGTMDIVFQAPKKKTPYSQLKEFVAECVFIDILTVVQGLLRVTREGYIVFASRHKTMRFDRMCIRGHQNESFLYVAVSLGDIRKIRRKRFNATSNAIEIKTKDGQELLFYFYRKEKDPLKKRDIDCFISVVENYVRVKKDAYNNYISSQKPLQWIDKAISNYEYLQWLNEIAGRSYCDITQYPVLPWVYVATSNQLDHPHYARALYRDLTKNMGLNGDQERISHFVEKFQDNHQNELFSQYHFGTHYSSSAIIFNFLVRMRPYSLGAITLQSGRFDVADRLFYSYLGSWNNATSSPTDLRQLIPQLYTLPELYININNYEYGMTQDKVEIDNVILPEWANHNPYYFVSQLRTQLESDYVSQNINEWINLIYGYKQRGKDAVQNINIFYPLTYENCIDLDKVTDEAELESFETQIAHFGQNPSQIIGNNPHPKRLAVKAHWEDKLIGDANQLIVQKCFLTKAPLNQSKFIFKSVFQGRNAILGVKFVGDQFFFVLRKHDYYLFEILRKQSSFLSKQQQVQFQLQSIEVSLNYKQLTTTVPLIAIHDQLILVGGFYNGHVQVIFLKEPKYNRSFRFPTATITALQYHPHYNILYLGDAEGYLRAYNVTVGSKVVEFEQKKIAKSHDSKINAIALNIGANLIILCSQDGTLSLYNSYSIEVMRTVRHPEGLPITFAHITTNPLYAVVFYSHQNSSVYVYSINGQFLDSFCEKSGSIHNMGIVKDSKTIQSLVYLNAQKEMCLWSLPFLQLRRRLRLKKDEFKVSCFQSCANSKIAVAGNEDGALQIVSNPDAY